MVVTNNVDYFISIIYLVNKINYDLNYLFNKYYENLNTY